MGASTHANAISTMHQTRPNQLNTSHACGRLWVVWISPYSGSIRLVHLQTADMPADMLTKALGRVKLQHMAALSGLGVGR